MAIAVIYKRPNETITLGVDFAPAVPSGETGLNNNTVTATKSDDTVDNTVVSSNSVSGLTLNAILTGGTDGEDYLVTYHAKSTPTANAGPFERTIEMRVRTKIGIGHV